MRPSRNSSFYVVAGFLVAGAPALLSGQVADPDATRFENALATLARHDAQDSFPAASTLFVCSRRLWGGGTRGRAGSLTSSERAVAIWAASTSHAASLSSHQP